MSTHLYLAPASEDHLPIRPGPHPEPGWQPRPHRRAHAASGTRVAAPMAEKGGALGYAGTFDTRSTARSSAFRGSLRPAHLNQSSILLRALIAELVAALCPLRNRRLLRRSFRACARTQAGGVPPMPSPRRRSNGRRTALCWNWRNSHTAYQERLAAGRLGRLRLGWLTAEALARHLMWARAGRTSLSTASMT